MKKLSKKLSLNKETIATLSEKQMVGIKGGELDGRKTCNSKCNTCCNSDQPACKTQ